MKVAILSESPADEAALQILVGGILGKPVDFADRPLRLRQGGWPSVHHLLPTVLKHLHYQTDTDALVVTVDSDNSPAHNVAVDREQCSGAGCRLCRLHQTVDRVQAKLKSGNRMRIRVAIGLAVPAIEAWYLCGIDQHATEAAMLRRLKSEHHVDVKNALKSQVYGTHRPGLVLETSKAVEAASRLAGSLDALSRHFPCGFGSLLSECRAW